MSMMDLIGFGAFTLDSGNIKSIQQVAITIGTGATSNTATISAVDTSKSVIIWNGFNTDHTGSSAAEVFTRIALTNATTVTASRNTSSGSFSVIVRATVVEFTSSMVNSVQAGTIAFNTSQTSNTATITSVNTSYATVLWLGAITDYTSNSANTVLSSVQLTNATTVTANRNTAGGTNMTVGYMVVEFQAAVIQSIQPRAVTLATNATSSTDTISSVSTGNTLLLHNGSTAVSANWANAFYYTSLAGSTSVTLARTGTSSTSRTIYYTVLEFVSGVLNSLQRSTTAISGTSADTTITGVNTAKTLCNWCGQHTLNTASQYQNIFATAKLLDATTVRGEKNSTSTSSTASWEAVEFV